MIQLNSFLILIFFSSLASAIELTLHKVSDNFYELKVLNTSDKAIDIDSQLCLSLLAHLNIFIKDSTNKERSLAIKLNEKCKLDSFVTLQPYRFIGRRFHIEEFKTYYQLSNGSYDVSALLCDSPNINEDKNCHHSNIIKLTIKN